MDLMAYWKWDNYARDTGDGKAFTFRFNSHRPQLHSAIELGERLWLVSGKPESTGARYVLLACLKVSNKHFNPPDYKYGGYGVVGDQAQSLYYSPNGQDVDDLLRRLEFHPYKPIEPGVAPGQALQAMRRLTANDAKLLLDYAKGLRKLLPSR